MKLRVVTYNIHKGVSSIGSKPRVHALKKAIGLLRADVLFLQEVQGRHDRHAERYGEPFWPSMGQHEFFAGDSHHAAYGMNAVYDHGHHGNALLSVHPILGQANHDVSDHAYEQRGILHCVLETGARPVHCYVVHFGLFEAGRGRQADQLVQAVSSSAGPDEPVIIAGDFNDWRNSLSERLRQALGVREVFDELGQSSAVAARLRALAGRPQPGPRPARTFPALMPWLRLDRIYVRGFQVEAAEVLHGSLWGKLSDHAPIVANLALDA
ncbi:endonuclease/exonuclease/phosphatase family protein [Massilia sp. TS11]|uniref:endonuclease/exonuclease/phosphatase family protein n=1 Tax=Massilia sp. TS11 TaxID=2908003 RepID=UPI001EDAB968|nr:endonuclease/exonuclease/phosphatase family protein [Massilia sp. TS11]MCG2584994.1 endonuclease/exonuclease/phosphatase family protein [Massilia sp. TS11]